MLAAARFLFREQGYAVTAIAEVAVRAGVSEPTVYRLFGSKRALLMGLLGQMSAHARTEEAFRKQQAADGDAHRQLRIEVEHTVALFSEWIDFAMVILHVGPSDPAVAAVATEGDRRRRERQAPMVRAWARAGTLRAGLGQRRAADVLWALTGPEMFDLMTRTVGWSDRSLRTWLADLLERELLGPAPAQRS